MSIPYRHIAIEGGIGAGKSTLATALAERLGTEPLLEPFADNPFLEQFYLDPERYAFPVELSPGAAVQAGQGRLVCANALPRRPVSDYVFAKSDLFAKITLPKAEYALFRNLYEVMAEGVAKPELIVYLRPGENQRAQIAARGRSYEQDIDLTTCANWRRRTSGTSRPPEGAACSGSTPDLDFVARAEDLEKVMAVLRQP